MKLRNFSEHLYTEYLRVTASEINSSQFRETNKNSRLNSELLKQSLGLEIVRTFFSWN